MEKWVTGEPITASKMNQIGDSIDNLTRAVDDSAVDLISLYGTFTNRSVSGITFNPLRHGFSINGTAENAAFVNIFTLFPPIVKGDDILVLRVNTSQPSNIGIGIFFYDENNDTISRLRYISEDTEVYVPENAVKWTFRAEVSAGTVCNDDTISVALYKKMNSLYPYDEIYNTIHGMVRLLTPEHEAISTAPPVQNFGVSYNLTAQWYPPSSIPPLPSTLSVRWEKSQKMSVSGTTLIIS